MATIESFIGRHGDQQIDFEWRPIWPRKQGRKAPSHVGSTQSLVHDVFSPQFSCSSRNFCVGTIYIKSRFLRFLSFLTSVGARNFARSLAKFYSLEWYWCYFRIFCPTVRLKWIATLSVDMHLLHHYKSNLAHLSYFYSLVIGMQKSEIWAKILKNEGLDIYLQNLHTFK